ncbi:MAG: hypothetical protein ACHQFW_09170 [Chitinophagales bacterium]
MTFRPNQPHLKIVLGFFLLLSVSFSAFASNNSSKSPYHSDPNPLKVYYFGYNMVHPGFGFGTELKLVWTKMEKTGCRGSRISDRQLLFVPNLGMFENEQNSFSAFGNLEINYAVTYNHGLTLEIFGAAGYAQMLSEGEAVNIDSPNNKMISTEAHSGFMPEAGVGFGYDFQKLNGKDFPLALNFRGMATSTNIAELGIYPSFTAGLTYDF